MRKLHSMFFIGMACLGMTACQKSLSEENGVVKTRSDDFQASVLSHKYKLVSFYSDKPIDYITSDTEVKSETDLWPYVKQYLIDDQYFFGANGALSIHQMASKMPGNDTESINASYELSMKGTDVMVKFVDYMYSSFEYKLHEFDNTYFTVFVDGPSGSKLYSKYARVE